MSEVKKKPAYFKTFAQIVKSHVSTTIKDIQNDMIDNAKYKHDLDISKVVRGSIKDIVKDFKANAKKSKEESNLKKAEVKAFIKSATDQIYRGLKNEKNPDGFDFDDEDDFFNDMMDDGFDDEIDDEFGFESPNCKFITSLTQLANESYDDIEEGDCQAIDQECSNVYKCVVEFICESVEDGEVLIETLDLYNKDENLRQEKEDQLLKEVNPELEEKELEDIEEETGVKLVVSAIKDNSELGLEVNSDDNDVNKLDQCVTDIETLLTSIAADERECVTTNFKMFLDILTYALDYYNKVKNSSDITFASLVEKNPLTNQIDIPNLTAVDKLKIYMVFTMGLLTEEQEKQVTSVQSNWS